MSDGVFLVPSVRALLAGVGTPPPASATSPEAQRAGLDGALAAVGWEAGDPPQDAVPLASGALVHVFMPSNEKRPPVLVYLHGGSFVAGGLKGHGATCRALAEASRCAVALVDYRLAPEHLAPAALEDAVAAVAKLREIADSLHIDMGRTALLGDSAGGALAIQAALRLRDAGAGVTLLAVMNPMISPSAETSSKQAYGTGYFATAADFADGWKRYQPAGADRYLYADLALPIDLGGLPPMIMWTNEADPVRDEAEAFAERVAAAGGTVLHARLRGLIHAAWLFGRALPEARLVLATIGGTLRATLAGVPRT